MCGVAQSLQLLCLMPSLVLFAAIVGWLSVTACFLPTCLLPLHLWAMFGLQLKALSSRNKKTPGRRGGGEVLLNDFSPDFLLLENIYFGFGLLSLSLHTFQSVFMKSACCSPGS